MVIFSKSYPFKSFRGGYVCLLCLIHLLHTESMQSETPCQLSQHGGRLHQLSQCRRHQHLRRFPHFALTQLTWSSLSVDLIYMETHLAMTQLTGNETPHQLSHRQMLKIWISRRIQEQNQKHLNAWLFSLNMFVQCKKPEQKIIMQVYLQGLAVRGRRE